MPARKKEETAEEAKELLQTEEQKAPEEPKEQEETEKQEEQKEPEKKTGRLLATRPILYQGRQFTTGEQLPNYDEDMVEAWLKYGSAKYE